MGKPSQGKQCAAFGCNSRAFKVGNGQRENTDIKVFYVSQRPSGTKSFCWCNDIKRQNGRDGFKVTNNTVVCSKHFEISKIYRPPGGTKQRLIENARPVLHEWNNVEKKDAERKKKPLTHRTLFRLEQSPQKSTFLKSFTTRDNVSVSRPILEQGTEMVVKEEDSNQLSELETLGQWEATDQPVTKECKPTTLLEFENSSLKAKVQLLESMNNSLKSDILKLKEETFQQKHSFVQQILSTDKSCNHYTGIPSIGILTAIYKYLDSGVNGENVILYNNQEIRQDTSRGRKREHCLLQSPTFRHLFDTGKIIVFTILLISLKPVKEMQVTQSRVRQTSCI